MFDMSIEWSAPINNVLNQDGCLLLAARESEADSASKAALRLQVTSGSKSTQHRVLPALQSNSGKAGIKQCQSRHAGGKQRITSYLGLAASVPTITTYNVKDGVLKVHTHCSHIMLLAYHSEDHCSTVVWPATTRSTAEGPGHPSTENVKYH